MALKRKYEQYMQKIGERPGAWEVNGESKEHLKLTYYQRNRISSGADHQTVLYARAGDNSTGYAMSQCLEDEPEKLLEQAAQNGELLENRQVALVNSDSDREWQEEALSLTDGEEMQRLMQRAEKELPGENKIFQIKQTVHTQWIVNQKGLNRQSSRRHYELEAIVNGRDYVMTSTNADQMDLSGIKADIEEMCKNDLPEISYPSGTYRAILSNYVMAKFWITGWQLFNGRQYASGTGAFQKQFSQKIASEKVNIEDVPALPGIGYEALLDCEGTIGKAATLVQNGLFCGLMHNLDSAAAMNMEPTGNAGRTAGLVIGTDIVVTPRNFVMRPGSDSDEMLLKELQDGLYIFDAFDEFHAVNPASGQFSFPCSAVLVEKGVRKGIIKGLTMNGYIGDLMQNIEAVGNRLWYMPLIMHYTYQVAAPAVLVNKLNIIGHA